RAGRRLSRGHVPELRLIHGLPLGGSPTLEGQQVPVVGTERRPVNVVVVLQGRPDRLTRAGVPQSHFLPAAVDHEQATVGAESPASRVHPGWGTRYRGGPRLARGGGPQPRRGGAAGRGGAGGAR